MLLGGMTRPCIHIVCEHKEQQDLFFKSLPAPLGGRPGPIMGVGGVGGGGGGWLWGTFGIELEM